MLNQIQRQEQNEVIDIFLESIKDELNGKQRKELLSVVQETKCIEDACKGIMSK